jgi:hypothetical protein
MDLNEKKQNLEILLQKSIGELQRLETSRNQLAEQIIEIRGKLNLIKELEIENNGETTGPQSTDSDGGTN